MQRKSSAQDGCRITLAVDRIIGSQLVERCGSSVTIVGIESARPQRGLLRWDVLGTIGPALTERRRSTLTKATIEEPQTRHARVARTPKTRSDDLARHLVLLQAQIGR